MSQQFLFKVQDEHGGVVDFCARKIAELYQLDPRRVAQVLSRTRYEGHIPEFVQRAWRMGAKSGGDSSDLLLLHSHRFSPSLVGALQCLQPQEALTLFETEDLGLLAEREALSWYLAGKMAPLYTLEELEGIISGFVSYLTSDREHILKTGFPSRSYEASPPLEKLLAPLYYIKKPVSAHGERYLRFRRRFLSTAFASLKNNNVANAINESELKEYLCNWVTELGTPGYILKRDEDGNVLYEYLWGTESQGSAIELASFEQPPLLKILKPEDAERIHADRGKLFALKLKLLGEMLICVQKRNPGALLQNCLALITQTLTPEEIKFYLRLDRAYIEAGPALLTLPPFGPRATTGGIIDLLEFIGHCEKELTVGTYATTKQAFSYCSLMLVSCLPPLHFEARSPYFAWVSLGKKVELESALSLYRSLLDQERDYWIRFKTRAAQGLEVSGLGLFIDDIDPENTKLEIFVPEEGKAEIAVLEKTGEILLELCRSDEVEATEEAGREMVTFTLPVTIENKREFERYITFCAGYFNLYVTTAGRPPVLASYPFATIPSRSEYMFRQDGDLWRIAYEGKELPAMKDTKGLHYIAYLLRHPGQSFFSTQLIAMFNGVHSQNYPRNEKDMDHLGTHIRNSETTDEIIDHEAMTKYRNRLQEIKQELEDAERNNNLALQEQLQQESDWITDEVGRVSGIGGKPRRSTNTSERARKAVQAAIRFALDKIGKHDQKLWSHLQSNIHTGTSCMYESSEKISWLL